jgi:hypothetical protein
MTERWLSDMKSHARRKALSRGIERRDVLLRLLWEKGASGKPNEPLDRIRVMKGLFLLSQETPDLNGLFHFDPYLYGAVSFEVYDDLRELQREGLVATTAEYTNERWNRYYLTHKGITETKKLEKRFTKSMLGSVQSVKRYVSSKQTYELLKEIYAKYPKFAEKSVIRFSAN